MSQDIILELEFLGHSFLMGIGITVLYDILRILRRVVPHNDVIVSVEDFFYWIVCSYLIFLMLYRENNGVLRWFAVGGAVAGMILYKKFLGNFLVKKISVLISKILHLVAHFFKTVLRPLDLAVRRLKWRAKKSPNRLKMGIFVVKNKLTNSKKALKIILSKH